MSEQPAGLAARHRARDAGGPGHAMIGSTAAARGANTLPSAAMPSAKPSWRAVLTAPAAIPPRCGGTAAIAAEPSVGVARPDADTGTTKPGISAGQLAEPCDDAAAIRPPTPMQQQPAADDPARAGAVQEPADPGRDGEGAQRQRQPGQPGLDRARGPSTDCSQIEV